MLEDLHWIDKVSEEFLGFLAENVRDARILLLATYRPGYRPPWIDKSYAGQTPLQPLSRDDSIHIVRSVLSAERLIDLVTEEIVAKADGNPFFLEQLALHAGEARDLRSDLMVPNTIHDVVMARIDRLPDETKQLLQTAAVIGREFSLRLLKAVWKGAGAARRPAARAEPSRIRLRARRSRRDHLCLPPCADAGNRLWQPARAASPYHHGASDTRSKSSTRAAPKRLRNCWRFISAAATRPKRRSIMRSWPPRKRNAAGPTATR